MSEEMAGVAMAQQTEGVGKTGFVLSVAGAVVILDQITKWMVRRDVPPYDSIPVVDGFFSITHASNPGGAFSLFAGAHDGIRVPFFLIAATLAIGVLVYFIRQIPAHQRWLLFAVAGVLGGALGNLIDRVVYGAVTDFLLVYYRGWHWPAFNVADSFISIGVTILIAHSIFARDDAPAA
jgi:signal peptidase II